MTGWGWESVSFGGGGFWGESDIIACSGRDHRPRGVKAVQGREGYCFRIGPYRVIFDEDAAAILASYIGRRATTTYRGT